MNRKAMVIFLVAGLILPLAFLGCKNKVETAKTEAPEATPQVEGAAPTQTPEPSQTVATETIPPSAAPQVAVEKAAPVSQDAQNRNKDIQKALKNAGFYTGAVDGKIGPKTKLAVEEFQKSKGLKADGKVGPKTWAELEKYLAQ